MNSALLVTCTPACTLGHKVHCYHISSAFTTNFSTRFLTNSTTSLNRKTWKKEAYFEVRESESEAGRGGTRMRRLKIWRLVVFPSQSVLCKTEPDGGKLLSSSALRARQYAFRRYGGFDSTTKDTRQTLHHAEAARLSESKNFRRAATWCNLPPWKSTRKSTGEQPGWKNTAAADWGKLQIVGNMRKKVTLHWNATLPDKLILQIL